MKMVLICCKIGLLKRFVNLGPTNKLVTQQVYVQILPTTDQLMQKFCLIFSKMGPNLAKSSQIWAYKSVFKKISKLGSSNKEPKRSCQQKNITHY